MSKTNQALQTDLREKNLVLISQLLTNSGEEVLRVDSTKIAYPATDEEGNELFIEIAVKIPKGTKESDGGYSGYDGYALAAEYAEDVANKEKKKAEAAKNKKPSKSKTKPKTEEMEEVKEE